MRLKEWRISEAPVVLDLSAKVLAGFPAHAREGHVNVIFFFLPFAISSAAHLEASSSLHNDLSIAPVHRYRVHLTSFPEFCLSYARARACIQG